MMYFSFSALMLLVGLQEGYPACGNLIQYPKRFLLGICLNLEWLWKRRPIEQTLINSIRSCSFDIIVIIVWLVRCWTLPFLRACSRLDDSALDDRQLPDQCWVLLNWIQQSRARCDVVSLIGRSTPLAKAPHRPKSSTVVHSWIGTCNVTEELKAGGMDDVCEWWLVSTSKDFLIKNAGLRRIV